MQPLPCSILLSLFGATRTSHALDKHKLAYDVADGSSSEFTFSFTNQSHLAALSCLFFVVCSQLKYISCFTYIRERTVKFITKRDRLNTRIPGVSKVQ